MEPRVGSDNRLNLKSTEIMEVRVFAQPVRFVPGYKITAPALIYEAPPDGGAFSVLRTWSLMPQVRLDGNGWNLRYRGLVR